MNAMRSAARMGAHVEVFRIRRLSVPKFEAPVTAIKEQSRNERQLTRVPDGRP